MKNGPFTALIAGLTAVIVGGGVAIAYEVVVVPKLQKEIEFLRADVIGALDSSLACGDVIDEMRDRFNQLADGYEIRSDASETFFRRGDLYAGDASELFSKFLQADRLVTGAYLISATEESATDRCYDNAFLFE